ncbi:TRADD-N-associated membrane domain-containing protein [Actinacidiphila rubida]|uniref:Cyanobacterial TRADD-N associated 2 transmembrane domain-containing protein n=1 Tax=Actinacidiphila rubida TaxID=310780 RepID=A0A1H8L728_9ACTN|nr:hypothetical protein [Actinacidiphila rubida]SEO01020.1 hypothetical protein SAMN05216267_101574 [Actinacidiphila rubida]
MADEIAGDEEGQLEDSGQETIRRISFNNRGIVVTGGASVNIGSIGSGHQARRDPREDFLAAVRALALSEAKSVSLLSRVCMTAGAAIVLCGGLLALLNHGGAVGPSTALGGVLVGTCGGAFALQSKRSHKRLTDEALRVSQELQLDHSREETLALIREIENPALRDRLRSMTAMRELGLAPAPEDAANRVFLTRDDDPPQIESGD